MGGHDVRERLIESASMLFHAKSYGSVGINEVCAHADVRRGSFYYYFPSKEALALAVLEREGGELFDAVARPALATEGPVTARFERLFELLERYHSDRTEHADGLVGGCPIANLGQELAPQSLVIRGKVVELYDRFRTVYADALRDAVERGELPTDTDPEATARRIHAHVQGVLEVMTMESDPGIVTQLGVDVGGLVVRAG